MSNIYINEDRISHLLTALSGSDDVVSRGVAHICGKGGSANTVGWSYGWLSDNAKQKGIFSWFVDNDVAAAKQWFYLAARLEMAGKDKPTEEGKVRGMPFGYNRAPLMYALLSDSVSLINEYAVVDYPGYREGLKNKATGEIFAYLIQLALKEEWALLRSEAERSEARFEKRQKNLLFDLKFHQGLADGDMAVMESALQKLVEPRRHHELNKNYPIEGDFFSQPAITLAKLAWLKGYPVKVESPWVPSEFLPVAPLAQYDDVYDFLVPDWESPKRGFWGKLLGR